MNNELAVKIGAKSHKAFLQDGFYTHTVHSARLHRHNYAEIHVIENSATPLIVNGKTFPLENGTVVVVPRETDHCFKSSISTHKSVGFQIDFPFQQLETHKIPQEMATEFLKEIDLVTSSGDYTKVASFISLFCSYFVEKSKLFAKPITDYGFLIEEFFSNRYSEDICLDDLAETLHLSPRQAERLVIKYTGRTFRQELINIRLTTAKHLLSSTSMPPVKVAAYVGYQSYAGFYKAMKNFKE